MHALISIADFISANYAVLLSVFGFLLLALAKVVPNSQAGPVISKVQGAVDLLAGYLEAAGKLCHVLSQFLGDLIKSDGIGGAK